MTTIFKNILGALLVGLIAWFFWPSPTIVHEPGRIDTVRGAGPLRVDTVLLPTLPEGVIIHEKDTITRGKVEKGNIITRVKIENGLLELDKLTPTGLGITQTYHLPEISGVLIDGQGNTRVTEDKKLKRRKFWRKVEVIGVGIAGIFIGTKL